MTETRAAKRGLLDQSFFLSVSPICQYVPVGVTGSLIARAFFFQYQTWNGKIFPFHPESEASSARVSVSEHGSDSTQVSVEWSVELRSSICPHSSR